MDKLEKILAIAEDNDIRVREFRIAHHEGAAIRDGNDLAVAVSPALVRTDRHRAARVIGHELGHCVTGAFYGRQLTHANIGKCERQARRWYAEQMVPRAALRQYLIETDDDYWGAVEEFGVDMDIIIDACHFYFGTEPAGIRARIQINDL